MDQEIVRIERWKVRYGQHISEWLETVGELDALCSLGTFACMKKPPVARKPQKAARPFYQDFPPAPRGIYRVYFFEGGAFSTVFPYRI